MKTGMLWFDKQGEFPERVARAAAYYAKKYGHPANLCFVHIGQAELKEVNGIEIRESKKMLPNHLWLGVEEAMQ